MARTFPPIALLLVLLAPGLAAGGEVYRWTDAQGRVHYTQDLQSVPPGKREEARRWSERRDPDPVQRYASPEEARAAGRDPRRSGAEARVPFERRGNVMLVEARVNDRATATFVVDTGASDVAIPTALAKRLGITVGPRTPRRVYQTGGGPVAKPVVTLDSVQLGRARVEDVKASVSDAMEVGLLGGSFFEHFELRIDPAERYLTLARSEGVRAGRSEEEWRRRFRRLRRGLERLDAHLETHRHLSESRAAELEARREELRAALERLRAEAAAADVPHAWRR